MELEKYRALICAIETGSLSAAAQKLGYTPSGISRMMAALEEENGFPLLLRQRDGVRPTRNCKILLPSIRKALFYGDSCLQLSAQIRGLNTGTVIIGTAYSAYYLWLAEVMRDFRKKYPGIQVEIRIGNSTELLHLMEEQQIDLCIISKRNGTHHWIPLCEDMLVALLPADHPLARSESVPVTVFETEPYIDTYPGLDIDNCRVFEAAQITPNRQLATMDSYASYSMVEAGLGISMNNTINVKDWTGNVEIRPLDPAFSVEIGLAFAKEASPAAQTFIRFAKTRITDPVTE